MQARMRGLPVELQRRVRSVHWRRVALLGAMLLSASLVLVGVLAGMTMVTGWSLRPVRWRP